MMAGKLKKNSIYLLIIIVAVFAGYKYLSESSGTLEKESVFSFVEIREGNIITIQNGKDTSILIIDNLGCKLSPNLEVRPNALKILFNAIKDIRVKSIVSTKVKSRIEHKLTESGTTVIIKKDNNELRNYCFVDYQAATYMKMHDSENIYIVNIPGFYGSFNQIFSADGFYWISKAIFKISIEQIQSIKVIYSENKSNSFVLNRDGSGFKFESKDKSDVKLLADNENLNQYLTYYSNVLFQKIVNDPSDANKILTEKPFCEISVRAKNSVSKGIKLYYKKALKNGQNVIDYNKVYVLIDNDILVETSYMNIDPLLKKEKYFR